MSMPAYEPTLDDVASIPVPVTSVDVTPLNSDGYFYGWSFREASGDLPAYTEGSVTSPAAGATIAQITGLAAGEYSVSMVLDLAGTLAAADANNMQAVPSSGANEPLFNLAVAGNYPQEEFTITVGASGSIAVKAINLATVGAIYAAQISVTPVNPSAAVVELQDGNQPLGEVAIPVGGSSTQFNGDPGVRIMNQIKVHVISGTVVGVVWAKYAH